MNNTIYKEVESQIGFVIACKTKNATEYINGCFNPEIETTYHPDGAKIYATRELAQKELDELKLSKDGFTVEEHLWL